MEIFVEQNFTELQYFQGSFGEGVEKFIREILRNGGGGKKLKY